MKLSWIAYPIMSLQRKGKKFEFTEKRVATFEKLKQLMKNAQVLKINDLEKESVVCIDACKRGLGGVLMQEGHSML